MHPVKSFRIGYNISHTAAAWQPPRLDAPPVSLDNAAVFWLPLWFPVPLHAQLNPANANVSIGGTAI